MSAQTVTLDVREDIRSGRDPFDRIMRAVAGLASGDRLRLVVPFEPLPLFQVLARQGFTHQATSMDSGDWEVLFEKTGAAAMEPKPAPPPRPRFCGCTPATVVEVDARGLEPPQPMIVILEAVATLPEGAVLKARTDRRPMHLYGPLQERGFVGESEEQNDGSFITHLKRA